MSKLREAWDRITLSMLFACLAAIAVAAVISWWTIWYSADRLLPLLALTGALLGWVAGMVMTPYSETEKKQFGDFAKVVSGIVTGFLLAKVGPLIDAQVAIPEHGGPAPILLPVALERLLITLASFLLSFLFVLGGRLYWSDDEEPLRQWIKQRAGKKLTRKEAIKLLVDNAGCEPAKPPIGAS